MSTDGTAKLERPCRVVWNGKYLALAKTGRGRCVELKKTGVALSPDKAFTRTPFLLPSAVSFPCPVRRGNLVRPVGLLLLLCLLTEIRDTLSWSKRFGVPLYV